MKYLTLFTSGNAENGKSTLLYKDITEFVKQNDGTITFKTSKGVAIETCLGWRINSGTKEQLEDLHASHAPAAEAAPVAAPRRQGRY